MNREILFRGKRLVEGEPVYMIVGSLFTHPDGHFTIGDFWEANPVDADTVGQYTGLKDRNGRYIFEGDILRDTFIDPEEGQNDELMIVRFKDFRFEAYTQKYPDVPLGLDELPDPGWWEIIGNIWDNPELVRSLE